uniref:Uncharacterized protein n=1 Tax=Bos indicus x Bos taurus TaxID=30522 RepID=A0A4W2E674_BOBOX
MGAAHSASEEVRELEGKTGFSSDQIEQLHRRFKQLSGDQPTIRKENFNNVPDLELNPIRSKIVRAFFDNRNLRKGTSGLADEINFEDFLTIMSYFRPIDTTMDEEQVQLCRKEKLRCGRGAAVGEPAHRKGVGALHRRRRHDGGGQRLRGADGEGLGPLSPRSTLRLRSPARCESVLLEGLEGRDRTWPAHHSSWAWRRALLRGLAAFLSHQTRSEVPVLGGWARQGRLGFGGPQTLLDSLPGPTGSIWHSARPSWCTAGARCH